MENIKLRNYKAESGVLGLLSLILAVVIFYWAMQGHMTLRISGAKLDAATSSVLLYIIGIGPLLTGINLLIKFVTVILYGEFNMVIEKDQFVYPRYGMFKGFRKGQIEKSSIGQIKLILENKKPLSICFVDHNNKTIDYFETEILHPSVNAESLAKELNDWLRR